MLPNLILRKLKLKVVGFIVNILVNLVLSMPVLGISVVKHTTIVLLNTKQNRFLELSKKQKPTWIPSRLLQNSP